MQPNDLLLTIGAMILVWILGLIQGYAIGRRPISKKAAAKVLAQASAKARKTSGFMDRKPMNLGGIEK